MSRLGLSFWEQYTVGLGPDGKLAFMKFCLSFSFLKVKVGFVINVTNTLFVFTFAEPDW